MNAMTVDTFTAAYLASALWARPQYGDIDASPDDILLDEASIYDLPAETVAIAEKDCNAFRKSVAWLDSVRELTDYSDMQAGHDFFLTRTGHGAGFWDRGLGDIGEALTAAACSFGENYLYVGDDGRILWERGAA